MLVLAVVLLLVAGLVAAAALMHRPRVAPELLPVRNHWSRRR